MISDVDVCNKALNYLQAGSISSLEDNTAKARACLAVFDTIRDSVLADYPWSFATHIEVPELIVDEVLVGWLYLYAIPAKCLAIRKIFVDTSVPNPDPIEYEECVSPSTLKRAVAVNYEDPYMRYTRQIVNPALWSVKFSDAMAMRLAAEIGATITGKQEAATEAANRYGTIVSEAKRLESETKHVEKTRTSSYEDAR
jgi:hypothetical protein